MAGLAVPRQGFTRLDAAVAAGLAGLSLAVCVALLGKITRPFWYDEVWRPHFVGEPAATFWSELANANVPSALGWIGLTRLIGEVVGWHAWALRAPVVLSLPLLAAAGYLLARRFTCAGAVGTVAAAAAAATLGVAGTIVDAGTQLKPYSIEALVTVAVVGLWVWRDDWPTGGRPVLRRTLAGLLCLFSVPAVFVIVPLAVADVGFGRGRRRLVAAGRAAPGVVVAGLHALLFVGHQSAQRGGTFWDTNFLAGRGLAGGLRFVGAELLAIASGAPPGVDLPDPNLVHPATDATWVARWLFAPAVVVAFAVGARTVVARTVVARSAARRRDGQYLLAALVGAEGIQLAASAGRYWPFGAVRTNLFVVPLLVVVVAAGAARLARSIRWRRDRLAASLGALVVTGLVVAVALSSTTALDPLWRERDRTRPIELLGDATAITRSVYQPGDLVVVGGRLARPGWSYAMELSDDAPSGNGVPPPPGLGPRLPRTSTVFVASVGDGSATRAVADHLPAPAEVILFVLDYDRSGTATELDRLRAAGWCQTRQWSFELTGTLYTVGRCPPVSS